MQTLDLVPLTTTAEEAERIAAQVYGVRGRAELLSGECDRNFRISTDGEDFLLKLSPPGSDLSAIRMQVAALEHLASTAPDLPVPRFVSQDGSPLATLDDGVLVRLTQWLKGAPVVSVERTPALHRSVATFAAAIDRGLRGFFGGASGADLPWNLSRASDLRPWARHIETADQRRLAEAALDRFAKISTLLSKARAQYIHNDIHHHNLLVDPDEPSTIAGLFDFGDMMFAPLINEVAITVAHQLYEEEDVLDVMSTMVGAYHQANPLEEMEIGLLPGLISARLASREIVVGRRVATKGDEGSYDSQFSKLTGEALSRVMTLEDDAIVRRLREACGLVSGTSVALPKEELQRRRDRLMGPAARQFYRDSFHPVRAEGIWVYDDDGKRYLDAYNNVPHVGHCHPHVTAAIARQARTLNTNTRYLDETILDYADRLTATTDHGLDTVMLVCTGTEANDLAWQLARAWSGGAGAIATDSAFHGNSTIISRLDTATLPENRYEPWLATVRAPRYPGRVADDQTYPSAEDYAEQYATAIRDLRGRGHEPAAFFMCPFFASDGLYAPPPGYMDGAIAKVRETNALIVCDEVQSGFGRAGTAMWGYQALGVAPDILTLGKPIANGFPMGALITRREILERFTESERYFNTFGGNPVACAAGLAVLDVMEREDLMTSARIVGGHLRAGLEGLAETSPLVGDVRGRGLFLGVEVTNGGEPAPAIAREIIEEMRRRGVLIGITGWGCNLLKIRPPLCVTKANADVIVETLAAVLESNEIERLL